MKKNILLIPRIDYRYDNLYLSIDNNWHKFLKKVYGNFNLEIAPIIKNKPDLIILAGGNDLLNKKSNKADKYRNFLNKKFLKYAIKNKIKVIGICLGAQFIASKFSSKIIKNKGHVGIHKIFYDKKLIKKKFPIVDKVNSFHDYSVFKLGKSLIPLGKAEDKTVEIFIHKKLKLLGIMWHPERFKILRKLDQKIFTKNLWN